METDNKEILDFINKKNKESINHKVITSKEYFFSYMNIISNSLFSSYNELSNKEFSIISKNLIIQLFFIFSSYTNNHKLTMFMSERAILLFNEYIKVSKSYQLDNLNLIDIKTFIINKTIGPIKFKLNYNNHYSTYFNLFNLIDYFFEYLFIQLKDTFKFNIFFIQSIIGNVVFRLYESNFNFIKYEIENIMSLPIKDIIYNVNMFKLKSELVLKYNNIEIINDFIDKNDFSELKNNYFNIDEKFNENKFFIYSINNIKLN
jgi:hypothetical protein